jgi:hypothetical protein
MSETGYGQTGLWNEAALGPVAEPVPRRPRTRVRTPRQWTPAGDADQAAGRPPGAPDEAVSAPSAATLDLQAPSPATAADGPQASEETDWARDDAWPSGLVCLRTGAAFQIDIGTTVWYRGEPHVVKDVERRGSFGFRVGGPCPPYFGLAGIRSMVTRTGRRTINGRLIERGVIPHLLYTERDGERLGWVSHLLCRVEQEGEYDQRDQRGGYQERVWWARRKLSTF